jgi:hypothetical protein
MSQLPTVKHGEFDDEHPIEAIIRTETSELDVPHQDQYQNYHQD